MSEEAIISAAEALQRTGLQQRGYVCLSGGCYVDDHLINQLTKSGPCGELWTNFSGDGKYMIFFETLEKAK